MKPRRKYLHIYRTRHGRINYYYRRPHGPRVRMPDDYGSKTFWEAYELAHAGYQPPPIAKKPTVLQAQRGRVGMSVENMLRAAKRRALEAGQRFDLDYEWAIATITAQDFRCALTGIPFYANCAAKSRVPPFAPSFDRIDTKGGYAKGNVRIVIFAVNVMLMDWGEEIFATVANHYRAHKGRKNKILSANFFENVAREQQKT